MEEFLKRAEFELAYGRGMLPFALPAVAEPTLIRKAVLPKMPDNAAAICDALDHPIGSRPLRDLARGRRSACILICDITRPVPNRLFLRPMIETMVAERHSARSRSRSWSRPACIVRTRATNSRKWWAIRG